MQRREADMTRAQTKLLKWFADQYGAVIWQPGAHGSNRTREALQRLGLIREVHSRRSDKLHLIITDEGRALVEKLSNRQTWSGGRNVYA
jgi:hypothetical protein